jgi:site-specific recombinase XerD
MESKTSKSQIYLYEVVENKILTVQFLAKSEEDIKIAKKFNAISHSKKHNIWFWYITENQDIRPVLQKNKNFVTCFIRNPQKCVDYFHNYLKFERLQPHTIKCYMNSINKTINEFPSITSHGNIPSFDEILDFLNNQNWMQSYINQHINALKKFFYEILFVDRKKYRFDRPQNEDRIRNILNANEINLLTSYRPNTRTNLLIETAIATGLKTNELENLKVTDFSQNRLIIGGTRPRTIEIPNHLTNKINNYLNTNHIENREYIFSNNQDGKLSKSTLQKMIRDVRNELNLDILTLKDFRHTLSFNLQKKKVKIEKIQEFLGYFGLYFSVINSDKRIEINQSA